MVPLFRIYAVLLLARGVEVTSADVHNAWAAWMAGRDSGHAQLKPYPELAPEVAGRDERYAEAIRQVARLMAANRPR
ncbi:putative glutamine amidotransferase, class I [Actinoplanes sp. N902-109]|nr:putative glutamine amidotransferase, class I [Actinoplanes sp. N902-109]